MTEQEIALAEEADSLPIHVRMCAMRHQQLRGEITAVRKDLESVDAKLSRISAGVWAAALAVAGMAGSIYATGVIVARGLIVGN